MSDTIRVVDFNIIDEREGESNVLYIRELVDVDSYEFSNSKFPLEYRLKLVEMIGVDNSFTILARCFTTGKKNYDIELLKRDFNMRYRG